MASIPHKVCLFTVSDCIFLLSLVFINFPDLVSLGVQFKLMLGGAYLREYSQKFPFAILSFLSCKLLKLLHFSWLVENG